MITDLNTATLAYYEYSGIEYQSRLIPVWIFNAEYYDDSNLVTTAYAYVPADTNFSKPFVTINSPHDMAEFTEGEEIMFDASIDSEYGTEPYTYEWTSDADGDLSEAPTFTSDSLSVNCDIDCRVITHQITLTVTDSKGLESSDSVAITVQGSGPCPECPDSADLDRDGLVDFVVVGFAVGHCVCPRQAGHSPCSRKSL